MGPPLISFLQKGNFFGEDGFVGRLRGLAGAWGCPVSTPQGPGQMPNEQIHKGTLLNVRVKRKWVKPLKNNSLRAITIDKRQPRLIGD